MEHAIRCSTCDLNLIGTALHIAKEQWEKDAATMRRNEQHRTADTFEDYAERIGKIIEREQL